eukprot:4985302-Pyramimonas_sp.AAC.1
MVSFGVLTSAVAHALGAQVSEPLMPRMLQAVAETSEATATASALVRQLTKRCAAVCKRFSDPVAFTLETFLAATGPAG